VGYFCACHPLPVDRLRPSSCLSVLLVLSMLNVVGYQPTERNNSDSEIRKALAMFSTLTNATFRSPHSSPPMYVRSRPRISANSSCDRSRGAWEQDGNSKLRIP